MIAAWCAGFRQILVTFALAELVAMMIPITFFLYAAAIIVSNTLSDGGSSAKSTPRSGKNSAAGAGASKRNSESGASVGAPFTSAVLGWHEEM